MGEVVYGRGEVYGRGVVYGRTLTMTTCCNNDGVLMLK